MTLLLKSSAIYYDVSPFGKTTKYKIILFIDFSIVLENGLRWKYINTLNSLFPREPPNLHVPGKVLRAA